MCHVLKVCGAEYAGGGMVWYGVVWWYGAGPETICVWTILWYGMVRYGAGPETIWAAMQVSSAAWKAWNASCPAHEYPAEPSSSSPSSASHQAVLE